MVCFARRLGFTGRARGAPSEALRLFAAARRAAGLDVKLARLATLSERLQRAFTPPRVKQCDVPPPPPAGQPPRVAKATQAPPPGVWRTWMALRASEHNGDNIWAPTATVTASTDSSLYGWGGTLQSPTYQEARGFWCQVTPVTARCHPEPNKAVAVRSPVCPLPPPSCSAAHRTKGRGTTKTPTPSCTRGLATRHWTVQERDAHINCVELRAVKYKTIVLKAIIQANGWNNYKMPHRRDLDSNNNLKTVPEDIVYGTGDGSGTTNSSDDGAISEEE
ncbi:hypothetical protein NFJ02_04g116300 [Pycnococcus provasolii]